MHRDGLALRLRTRSDTVRFVYLHTILRLCHILLWKLLRVGTPKKCRQCVPTYFFFNNMYLFIIKILQIVYSFKLVLFYFIIQF